MLYRISDPLAIPVARYMVFSDYSSDLERGASKEFLHDAFDKIIEAANAGQPADVGRIAYLAKDALELTTTSHMLKMASVLYLIKDENPFEYEYEVNAEKIAALKKLKKKEWLSVLLKNSKEAGKNSLADTLTSLDANARKMRIYEKTIASLNY
jgi:hypothetical protein